VNDLKFKELDINDIKVVEKLQEKLQQHFYKRNKYYNLLVNDNGTFKLDSKVTKERGWYIILDEAIAIYVGKSLNLNARLNTISGSQDNFANISRKSDVERNFIKKYVSTNNLKKLRVCIISEKDLNYPNLDLLDCNNIEKFLNITRGFYTFSQGVEIE